MEHWETRRAAESGRNASAGCTSGEGAFRTRMGHLQGLFQGEAGGHDFPEKPGDLLVVEGSHVLPLEAPQDLGFALWPVDVAGFAVPRLDLPTFWAQ